MKSSVIVFTAAMILTVVGGNFIVAGLTAEPAVIGLELSQGPITYTVTAYPGRHVISFKKISTGSTYAKDLYINDAITQFCGIWVFGKEHETLRISYNCGSSGAATFREWKLEELFPFPW